MHKPTTQPRCGTVAIIGIPNAGKSTLLNSLVGEKVSIVSHKVQTTRRPISGVMTHGPTQVILSDQPGLFDPKYLLHEAMREAAVASVRRADAVLYLSPATKTFKGSPPPLGRVAPQLANLRQPVAIIVSKAELLTPNQRETVPADVLLVSTRTGEGVEAVRKWCLDRMPAGAHRCEADDLSVDPVRVLVSEFVRETAFEMLHEEVPYGIAAEVDEYRETSDPVYIRVTIYVETASQKRIVIGSGGNTIKTLGTRSRRKIEALIGAPAYLDLWVKVLPKWRSNAQALARFGLPIPKETTA